MHLLSHILKHDPIVISLLSYYSNIELQYSENGNTELLQRHKLHGNIRLIVSKDEGLY